MRRVIKIYCCFRKQHHLFHLGDIAPAGGVAGTAELSVALPQSRLGKVQASLTLLSLLHRFVFDAVLEDACLCYSIYILLSSHSITIKKPLSLHLNNKSPLPHAEKKLYSVFCITFKIGRLYTFSNFVTSAGLSAHS